MITDLGLMLSQVPAESETEVFLSISVNRESPFTDGGASGLLAVVRPQLQMRSKSRSMNDAGWSSLVARRAHNPKVVSSNLTPATNC